MESSKYSTLIASIIQNCGLREVQAWPWLLCKTLYSHIAFLHWEYLELWLIVRATQQNDMKYRRTLLICDQRVINRKIRLIIKIKKKHNRWQFGGFYKQLTTILVSSLGHFALLHFFPPPSSTPTQCWPWFIQRTPTIPTLLWRRGELEKSNYDFLLQNNVDYLPQTKVFPGCQCLCLIIMDECAVFENNGIHADSHFSC